MTHINTIFCPFNIWILFQTNLTRDVIDYILRMLKTKPKIIPGCGGIALVLSDGTIMKFFNSNWIEKYGISVYDIKFMFYDGEQPCILTKDHTILSKTHVFKGLDKFMIENGLIGINKVVNVGSNMIILTTCGHVIYWAYDVGRLEIRVSSNEYKIKKIYSYDTNILLLDEFGLSYAIDSCNVLSRINGDGIVKKIIPLECSTYFVFRDGSVGKWGKMCGIMEYGIILYNIKKFYANDSSILYMTEDDEIFFDYEEINIHGKLVSVCVRPNYFAILFEVDLKYDVFICGDSGDILNETGIKSDERFTYSEACCELNCEFK